MKNISCLLFLFFLLHAEPLSAQNSSETKTSKKDSETISPLAAQGVCNTPCYNINFQSQTLNGWDAYYAQAASSSVAVILNGKTGGAAGSVIQAGGPDPNTGNYQVSLMTTPGVDPVAGSLIPYTPPLGGLSAMVGDGPVNGYGAGILEQTYMVDPAVPILTLQFAVVLGYSSGHSGYQQPWFKMEVLDQSSVPIPGCGQYFVVAGPGLPGFQTFSYGPGQVYCKPWTTAIVPLYNYIGQCVTVRFTTSDCSLGDHFGYAYVAASCSKIDLVSTSQIFCIGQQSATITGPPGAATYQWTSIGGCVVGSTTGQSVKITCCGTYSLIIQSSAGPQCTDTLSIVIPCLATGPPPTPCFSATKVCAGQPTSFNALCSTTSAGSKFYWDFYNSGSYNDSSGATPTWTYAAGGTYSVRLHIMSVNGCEADTSIRIFVDTVGAGLSTYFTTVTNTTTCGACNGKISFNIKGGNIRDTLKTSFDNTWAVIGGGVTPSTVGGVKSCGAIFNANGSLTLSLCNLCAGVYHFYIIPSSVLPTACSPGFYGDTITVAINSPGAIIPMLYISNDTIYSTHASSYQWYFNGFAILNGTDSFYVFNQTGTYNVFTIDSNGCGRLSNPLLYTSVRSLQTEAELKVYPNPAGNQLWIESPELLANSSATITLYNILGETVYNAQLQTTNSKLQTPFDVSSLAKGVYIVQLNIGDKVFRTKVMKE